jgi:Leucine-rich repeat (LRR) protein
MTINFESFPLLRILYINGNPINEFPNSLFKCKNFQKVIIDVKLYTEELETRLKKEIPNCQLIVR